MNSNTGPLTRDGRVSVVVDGSPTDVGAVGWAVKFAERAHARLKLVYTAPDTRVSSAMAVALETHEDRARVRREGQRVLDSAAEVARHLDSRIEVETAVVELPTVGMAATISAESTILVLGACQSGPLRNLVFGYSTITMINAATCPVLVWRELDDSEAASRPIVVGIDGSKPSKRALAAAFDLADIVGVELVAVHVGAVDEIDQLDYGTIIDWQHLREAERQWLQASVDAYRDQYPSVSVRALSVGASPARELRALSSTAQVLVVGSRGRSQLSAAVLGSVSQNLVHHAECPVLVVH